MAPMCCVSRRMLKRDMNMNNQHDTNVATMKILIAWIGAAVGSISLSDLVLTATLIFTVLQIVVLIRKLWRREA